MMPLLDIVLAQAQAMPSPDPATSLVGFLGGGAGAMLIWHLAKQFLGPLSDAWALGLKRKLGDSELEAKLQTRAMIAGVTDRIAEIAKDQRASSEALRDVTEALRSINKELIEFRSEFRRELRRPE